MPLTRLAGVVYRLKGTVRPGESMGFGGRTFYNGEWGIGNGELVTGCRAVDRRRQTGNPLNCRLQFPIIRRIEQLQTVMNGYC